MEAFSQQPNDRTLGRSVSPPDGDARTLTDVELDRSDPGRMGHLV